MSIRIAIIGAGSLTFCRRLTHDVLAVPELQDAVFAYTDINSRNLDAVAQLVRRDIKANKLGARVVATTDRRKAIEGANYVINCVRVGGLEAFEQDVEIPLKYGIDQCVGDTLCAGGIMYGQRNIPVILDFCRDIREMAAPDALFMNYANPNAMNTWAALRFGGVRTLGLCHGVEGGHQQIAKVIELIVNRKKGRAPGDKNYIKVGMDEVDIICAGINHQTWYIRAMYRGEDWAQRLIDGFEELYGETEKVRIDMMRRFGYYTTESNGHCSEYVAWYRKRPEDLRNWISLKRWIDGETGGYLRVCREQRRWFDTDLPAILAEEPPKLRPENRSREHGSYIIEALETGRRYRGHFNVVNEGIIDNLPADAIVEVPAYVDANGINVPRVGSLPLGCAAVCNASINVQRLAVHAAVTGDDMLLRQAMMMDPLTGAVCNPPEIWQMVDDFLVAQAQWLPQYRKVIAAARRRAKSGKRIPTKKWRGAARLKERTLSQYRAARAAAQKAAAQR